MTNFRRVCFTINNPTFHDSECLYELGKNPKTKYLIYGAEHENEGTPHFQGFIIFNQIMRPNAVQNLLGGRAHMIPPKNGDPSARCANYCKKEHFYMEFGSIGEKRASSDDDSELSAKECKKRAIAWLDDDANKWVRAQMIPGYLLMTPGFLLAWQTKRKTTLGPDRPNLKIITIIGPTACGKSFAAHFCCPDHAKCFYGNGGAWFSNGDAPVLLFEEFTGQIPLQKMLCLLDHYPTQLEEKGGFSPALYETVIITSNITPDHWYGNFIKRGKMAEEAERLGISMDEAEKKWNEAKSALFDRIGYKSNRRGCGYYREWTITGIMPQTDEINAIRSDICNWLFALTNAPNETEKQLQQTIDQPEPQPELDAPATPSATPELFEATAEPTNLQHFDATDDLLSWQDKIDSLFINN